jgi:HD-like signal output (HDOD) protein/ActR/RegA family two-component response regulator
MKRVLFVDDETALLDGLRGRLRGMRDKWDMVFVESAARAITEMELRPFDVIVTDMRMPGMDGAQLLNVVSERWPEVVRIVLSGYSDEGQSARLLSVAHQYLSKPCEAQQLENVVHRCIKLHALLREPRLRAAVGRIRQLPALPRTYAKLRQTMDKGDATVHEVSAVISADSAIAAKVLQIVNSAFFRMAKRVSRIEQAVTYLGFVAIRNLAMSAEVFSQWRQGSAPAGFDPERLQVQAQRVTAIAHALATDSAQKDDAMLAGLMHNIGYCVLAQQCSAELERAAMLAREKCIPMHEAEREVIGASHAEVGAYLLGLWGLPHQIIEAVAFQHAPQLVAQSEYDLLAILATAKTLALDGMPNAFGVNERVEGTIDESYLQSLHAPFDWREAQRRAVNALGESSI